MLCGTIKMDLLPDLAILEVFSFVSVEKRFKILRLVCRRWRKIVDCQIQENLVVYETEYPFKHRWPSDSRPIQLQHVVGKLFFDFYLTNNRYKAIKRLLLSRIDWKDFECE